jgi:hypothetical protein
VKARSAPAVVFIYQDHLLVAEERMVASAVFGDLQIRFNPHDRQDREWIYGPNGVWGPKQHTSISAITYFPNEGIPLTVHNFWASIKLPFGIFGGRECVPETDGTTRSIDHTGTG